MKGRKRFLLVDTLGLLWAVLVVQAGCHETAGAKVALAQLTADPARWARLEKIWADAGYQGTLEDWVADHYNVVLEIVKRPAEAQGFVVLSHRWIVERTFAWLSRFRRLAKDYEYLTTVSEALLWLAMTHRLLRRQARALDPAGPGRTRRTPSLASQFS